jgi:hypothetical protein
MDIPLPTTALTQKAYCVGVHHYAFRVGQAGEIIGLKFVKPTSGRIKYDWRLAYIVQYDDGFKDFVSLSDVEAGNYVITSDVQLAKDNLVKMGIENNNA